MIGLNRTVLTLGAALAVSASAGCKDDDEGSAAGTTDASSTGGSTSTGGGEGDTPAQTDAGPGSNDNDDEADDDTSDDGTVDGPDTGPDDDADTTEGPGPVDCEFTESFDTDGANWPAPWVVTGGVEVADVVGGRGRLRPFTSGYSLARIYAPLDCTDFEATFTFEFTDGNTQGAGFYVRQNGGHLTDSNPPGQGYSTFAEAFRDPVGLGVWREVAGSEENLAPVEPMPIEPNVVYAVRLRVAQIDASTTGLQARMWRAGTEEPKNWQVERSDSNPGLQGARGGIAVDAWSVLQKGTASDMFFDDIVVTGAQ